MSKFLKTCELGELLKISQSLIYKYEKRIKYHKSVIIKFYPIRNDLILKNLFDQ